MVHDHKAGEFARNGVSVQLGLDPSPDEEITICSDGVPPIDEHPVLQLLSSFWGEIH